MSLRVLPVEGSGGESFEVQARGELQLGLLIGEGGAGVRVCVLVAHGEGTWRRGGAAAAALLNSWECVVNCFASSTRPNQLPAVCPPASPCPLASPPAPRRQHAAGGL